MPTYNNPDNSGCDIPAEPYEVAILKLAKEEEPKCRCSNDLEYSNCSTKCERYSAELEEESFFIKTYNQAIDDVQSKFNILLSLDPKDISYRNLLKIAENLKTIIEEIEKLKK
jgi:hypothetical protein